MDFCPLYDGFWPPVRWILALWDILDIICRVRTPSVRWLICRRTKMRKGWIKCKCVVVRIIWDTHTVWQVSFIKYFLILRKNDKIKWWAQKIIPFYTYCQSFVSWRWPHHCLLLESWLNAKRRRVSSPKSSTDLGSIVIMWLTSTPAIRPSSSAMSWRGARK